MWKLCYTYVRHMFSWVGPMLPYVGVRWPHVANGAPALLGRRPAVRRKPLKSGRRPRARSLAGGLRLVTEGYIRSPPLPPTLLFDRGDTPARPPTKSARQIYMYLALDVRERFKNIVFYSVSWPSASTTGCPWCQLCVPRGQA